MDSVLQGLLSLQFLFFCLAIGAVVFVIRQIVEYAMVNWWPLKQWNAANKDSTIWRGLILPILPIMLGLGATVFAKSFPYPDGLTTTSGRLVFGLVAGFTSGIVVRLYNSFLSASVADFSERISSSMRKKKDDDNDDHDHHDHDDPGAAVRDTINKDQ